MRRRIPLIYAGDFPPEVESWWYEAHSRYEDYIVLVYDDGNPLWKWLDSNGEVCSSDYGRITIAVKATW